MNQSAASYVSFASPPTTGRAPNLVSEGVLIGDFGNHLSYAKTTVFDVLSVGLRSQTPTNTRTSDRTQTAAPAPADRSPRPDDWSTSSTHSASYRSPTTTARASGCESPNAHNLGAEEQHDDEAADDQPSVAVEMAVTTSSQTIVSSGTIQHVANDADHGAEQVAAGGDEPLNDSRLGSTSADIWQNAANNTPATATVDIVAAATQAATEQTLAEPTGNSTESGTISAARSGSELALVGDQTRPVAGPSTTIDPATIVAAASEIIEADPTASRPTNAIHESPADSAPQRAVSDGRRRTKPSVRAVNDRNEGQPPPTKPESPSASTPAALTTAPAVSAITVNDHAATSAAPGPSKPATTSGPLATAFRTAGSLTRGTRTIESPEAPRVDPARFVARVARAFHTAQERGGTLNLRLSPPELGALKLQLTVKEGVLTAALETENADARRLLLDHLPALRDRLADQNIRIDRFDVDVRQDQPRHQADPRGMNQHAHQQPQPERAEPHRTTTTELPTSTPMPDAAPLNISTSSINLVI